MYKEIAKQARIKIIDMIFRAQVSHVGSNFSCIDILSVLFEKIDLDKDKFILSKGWAAASLYYFLWRKGRITEDELNSFCQPGSKFIGLAEPIILEIPAAGGSLGIGFSMAVGMARARKSLGEEGRIWILMSDGEAQCGNVWESSRKVIQENLINVSVIMDKNEYCAMGKTDEILKVKPENLFEDWNILHIDGHDFEEIEYVLSLDKKPKAIIAHTIKGKGVSFMENQNIWHYKSPNEEEYKLALKELNE